MIRVDASICGLGAVLMPLDGKTEWVVSYGCRTVRDSERHYLIIKKDILACVWGAEHYRMFFGVLNL